VDGGRIIAVVFSCGAYTSPTLYYNKNTAGYRVDSTKKVITGNRESGSITVNLIGYGGGVPYPLTPGHFEITRSGVVVEMTYSITASNVSEHTQCSSVFVVPRGDAEAMYVHANSWTTRIVTPTSSRNLIGYRFARWSRAMDVTHIYTPWFDSYGNQIGIILSYTYTDPGASDADLIYNYNELISDGQVTTDVVTPDAVTDVSTIGDDRKLIAGGRLSTVDFDDIPEAHLDNIDDIGYYTFKVLSGTSVVTPTILAPGRAAPIGVQAEPPSAALVGWI